MVDEVRKNFRLVSLAEPVDVSPSGDVASALPVEFRIFRAGENPTSKGTFVFDDAAAAAVMAEASQRGVDLVIDLEHRSLDVYADNTATDAMGWFRLALRDGELWAVNVRWTPEGERRLRGKLQRYISPAFETDKEGSPTWLINVALTSSPATDHAVPLVAASARNNNNSGAKRPRKLWRLGAMDPELVKKAIEIVASNDADGALALLVDIVASAAGADTSDDSGDAAAGDPDAPPAESELIAAAARELTGQASAGEVVAALHAFGEARAAERERLATLELSSRRELIGELVRLGAETPATAWQGDPKDRKPCVRLSAVSVEDMRAHVTALRAAKAGRAALQPPPAGGAADGLTEVERRTMAALPENKREEYRQLRLSRRAS